ncbi:MAG: hypothetical protein ACTHM6_00090, partial [Tepidisphaeraceae bacterium]
VHPRLAPGASPSQSIAATENRIASPRMGPSAAPIASPAAAFKFSPTFFAQLNPIPQNAQAITSINVA